MGSSWQKLGGFLKESQLSIRAVAIKCTSDGRDPRFIIVIALEEDATSDDSAIAVRNAVISGLQNFANNTVQNFKPGQSLDNLDYKALGEQLKNQAIYAGLKEFAEEASNPFTLLSNLGQLVDPDDYINFGHAVV